MFQFRIGNIPVNIQPTFWLFPALLSFVNSIPNVHFIFNAIIYCLIFFVSVLAHELGHAFTYRYFYRQTPTISLFFTGGAAYFERTYTSKNYKRNYTIIILAGPLMNFILALLAYLAVITSYTTPDNINLLVIFLKITIYANIFWGIFNSLPIYPLDGGQIMHLFIKSPRKAHHTSMVIAIIAGLITFYLFQSPIILILVGFLAYQNYQMAQRSNY